MILHDHTIICGYGGRGASAARAMIRGGIPPGAIVAIDIDERRAASARRIGLNSVAGDARNRGTLRVAHVGVARCIVVSVPDSVVVEVIFGGKTLAPDTRIHAVLNSPSLRAEAEATGANQVIVISEIAGGLLADSVAPPNA